MTPAEVGERMDLGDVEDLQAAWRVSPPPHLALRQVIDVLCVGLGVKIESRNEREQERLELPEDETAIRALVASVNGKE